MPEIKDDLQGGLKRGPAPRPAPAKAKPAAPAPPAPAPPTGKAAHLEQTEKLATPAAPQFEPPHPVLQQFGFNKGGIETFNARTASVVDSYTKAYGVKPSAGLVFDLARSSVDTQDFDHLFTVPQSQFAAQSRGYVTSASDAGAQMLTRDDGLQVHPNPPGLPAANTLTALHAKYPTVEMGMFPVPGGDKILGALKDLNGVRGDLGVTQDGETLHQAQRLADERGITLDEALAMRREAGLGVAKKSVKSITEAQTELNKAMGTTLPVTGTFNPDWLKALSNWMKTKDYFVRAAQYQADKAGFKDYSSYLKAWKAKQNAVTKHGAAQFFLNALPLHAFSDGGNPLEVVKNTLSEPFANPQFSPTYALHTLTKSAGTTLDVLGGTVTQGKAYIAAGNAFTEAMLPKNVKAVLPTGMGGFGEGKGESFDDAKERARKALLAHPTWLRAFYPDLPEHESGKLKALDEITNIAGDILLLRKPALTGERVAAGSVDAARSSTYLNRAGAYAYDYVQQGKLGRASALLEGGAGSERFVAHAAKLVKDGQMSEEQFLDHLAELYATGNTTLVMPVKAAEADAPFAIHSFKDIEGPVLSSLRTDRLIAHGKTNMAAHKFVRDKIDAFHSGATERGRVGTLASDFTGFLRSEFSHASPSASTRGYFDPKLPERVHDFIFRHTGDAELANKFESDLVRARATENVARISKINERLQKIYFDKYPMGDKGVIPGDPFNAQLQSEAASRFYFPGGNKKVTSNPFDSITARARATTQWLNKASAYHRLIILSGAPLNLIPGAGRAIAGRSLFFKHMVGDTTRRIAGGDSILFTGLDDTKKQIAAALESNPALARKWGSYLDRSTYSETRYLTGGKEQIVPEFKTSERYKDPEFMRGAGAYVRRMLDDESLIAYRASSATDQSELVNLILHNDAMRRMWKKAQRQAAENAFGAETVKAKGISLTHYNDILPAEDFAAQIFNRYKALEEAAQTANTSLDDALSVLKASRGGSADKALGQWIKENGVDFTVKHAGVKTGGLFDTTMSKSIEQIMVFNKLNRGGMAKNVAAGIFKDLRDAGWDERTALETAMDVGEKQVTYHMLDFANMLQAEQDLRWLSYFATKHRLYWKWVLGTFVRTPMAAAVVNDARQQLDKFGNINVSIAGHKLAVPAARLFWVPGREYSEIAPTTQFAWAFLKSGGSLTAGVNAAGGTFGNVLTRSDTAMHLLGTWAAVETGHTPATYSAASAGLDSSSKAKLNRRINQFQQDYFHDHGHYAPPKVAIADALWKSSAEEFWRANLPLPVIPQGADRNETHVLLDKFMRLVDPAKRSKFLDDHPELQAQFGVSKNPADYAHYRSFWSRYTQALDNYHAVRQQIFLDAEKAGVMTAELDAQRQEASKAFNKIFDSLKHQDLMSTPRARQREIGGERLGLWGQQISADPLVDPKNSVSTLFPKIDPKKLNAALPSQLTKNAEMELKLLADPVYVAKTFDSPSEANTRRRQLLQFIDDFKSFPHDALGKLTSEYVAKHVNPFWAHVTAERAKIDKLGRGDKDLAYAQLRVWKDEQDKPVVINGVKFPSPVAAAWQNLPPAEFQKRIAGIASGAWDHLADYEKRLLDHPAPKGASAGWRDYTESVQAYHDQYPGARLAKNQVDYLVKALNKEHPGFRVDYLFAQKPHIERLEATAVYREMPADAKRAWNEEIAPNAKIVAKAYASGSYKAAELRHTWEVYVKTEVPKYLTQHPALKKWLQPFLDANVDFLNSLPVK